MQRILDVLNMVNVALVFCVPDVVALAAIVRHLPLSAKGRHTYLSKAAANIPIPFVFFRFEHFGIADFTLAPPHSGEAKDVHTLSSKHAKAAHSPNRLLSFIPLQQSAPPDIARFIEFHQTQAQLEADYHYLTHIQHFVAVKGAVDDDFGIVPSREEILRRWRASIRDTECSIEESAIVIEEVILETEALDRNMRHPGYTPRNRGAVHRRKSDDCSISKRQKM